DEPALHALAHGHGDRAPRKLPKLCKRGKEHGDALGLFLNDDGLSRAVLKRGISSRIGRHENGVVPILRTARKEGGEHQRRRPQSKGDALLTEQGSPPFWQ